MIIRSEVRLAIVLLDISYRTAVFLFKFRISIIVGTTACVALIVPAVCSVVAEVEKLLFMGDWIEHDPLVIIKSILSEGWDAVLIDSFAELAVAVVDFHGGTMKNAETKLLNLFEKHNKAENQSNRNTCFMIIQQVTKGGEFAGSNRFKHMITAMAHMKFVEGGRAMWFSKNRRGGEMNKLHFSLDQRNHVGWLFTEPLNMAI